jgi:hypothetical protein
VTCASGTATQPSLSSSEASPAVFSITGFSGDPLCTATESPIPSGYITTGTCSALLSVGVCTIVNTQDPGGPPNPTPCGPSCPVGGVVDLAISDDAAPGSESSTSPSNDWMLLLLLPLAAAFIAGGTWFARKQ